MYKVGYNDFTVKLRLGNGQVIVRLLLDYAYC